MSGSGSRIAALIAGSEAGEAQGASSGKDARPRDCRLALIEDQPIEQPLGIGGSDPPGTECRAIMRGGLAPAGIPASDRFGSPLHGPIGVALVAGVRGSERY